MAKRGPSFHFSRLMFWCLGGACLAVFLALGAIPMPALADPATQAAAFPAIGDGAILHNAHQVTRDIFAGAQPEGDAAFKMLADMGVKTILSVDGAAPDVAAAKAVGLRYVHLPITYSGVTDDEGKALAKALEELPKPLYVHCHHGKHRVAAAVAVGCVMNGKLEPEQAQGVLATFGTGENYKGLWKAAKDARPLAKEALLAVRVNYVEKARIGDVAQAMVNIDHYLDNLKLAEKSGWLAPPTHPDVDPPHEALQLMETLREIPRTTPAGKYPADFFERLRQSELAAASLETALREATAEISKESSPARTKIDAAMKSVSASCASCHLKYRD